MLDTRLDGQQAGGCAGRAGMQLPLSLLSWQETSPAVPVPRLGGACTGIGAWLGVANLNVSYTKQRQEAALHLRTGFLGAKSWCSQHVEICVKLTIKSQVLGDLSSALH